MPLLPAKLTSSAGAELPASAVIPVDQGGTTLAFEVPEGSELVAATLTIVAPGDDRTIDLLAGPQAATLASSQGAGPPPNNLAVAWLTADWRTRRSLAAVSVSVSGTTPGLIGTIKLAEDGPWYPPSPARLTLGTLQRLPSLCATRLMVEFVSEAGGVQTPSTAIVTEVALQAAARPGDLTVSLAGEPFASHDLAFDPRETWPIDQEFLTALRTALADRGGPVQLRLRSGEPAQLQRITLTIDRIPRILRFTGGPQVTGQLPAEGVATIPIAIPADAAIDSLRFTLRAELPAERPATSVGDDPPGPHAHRVTPDRSAAQGFNHAPGAALAGLDLHVRPLTAAVKASASIHEDSFGEPAPAPLISVALERALATDPPHPSAWWRFDLPAPLTLPDGPWWVCLTVAAGDLLWHVDADPVAELPGAPTPRSARWRHGVDAWQLREVPGPGPVRSLVVPWARTRVRLAADPAAPPPAPTLRLRWRGAEIDVTADADGRVVVTREQLAPLASRPPGPLEIVVASAIAGSFTAANLELRLALVRDTATLGLA